MLGRRERRKERTRRALLDAALKMFAERGVAATRMEDLTEEVDLGKGAFYNYFDSKVSLVGELLAEGIEKLDREFLEPVAPPDSVAERVALMARQHEAFFERYPEYLVLFHQARGLLLSPGSAAERLRDVLTDYLRRLGARLAPTDGREGWSEGDRLDLAAAFAGAIAGYRSLEVATGLAPRGTVDDLLTVGLPPLIERRRAASR